MRKALDGVWEHPAARVEDTPSLPQVDVLLGRLEGVRRAGAGSWMARCPAHPDRNPSLSVSVKEGRGSSSTASRGAPLRPSSRP
jgi:putative DNA primase/helicase